MSVDVGTLSGAGKRARLVNVGQGRVFTVEVLGFNRCYSPGVRRKVAKAVNSPAAGRGRLAHWMRPALSSTARSCEGQAFWDVRGPDVTAESRNRSATVAMGTQKAAALASKASSKHGLTTLKLLFLFLGNFQLYSFFFFSFSLFVKGFCVG